MVPIALLARIRADADRSSGLFYVGGPLAIERARSHGSW